MANEFKFEKKLKQPLPMSVRRAIHLAIRHDLYRFSMTYMLGAVIFSTGVPAVMSVYLDDKISVVTVQHWLIGTGITMVMLMAMLIPIILICWLVDYQIYKNSCLVDYQIYKNS